MDLPDEQISSDMFGETYYHLMSNNPQYSQDLKLISKKHTELMDTQYMKIYGDKAVTYDEVLKHTRSGVCIYSLFSYDYGYSGQFVINYNMDDSQDNNYKCDISYNVKQLVSLTDNVPMISYDIGDFEDYDYVKDLDDSYIITVLINENALDSGNDFFSMGFNNWKAKINNPDIDCGLWNEIHPDIHSIYLILKQRKDLMRIDPLYAKKYIIKLVTDLYAKRSKNNIMLVKMCIYFYLSVRTMNLPCQRLNLNGIMLHPKYYHELSEKPKLDQYIEQTKFSDYDDMIKYYENFINELFKIISDNFNSL
jgi:hypothetical protein